MASDAINLHLYCWATAVAANQGERRPTILDLETEHVFPLTDGGQHLPRRRGGRKPHPSTMYRWAKTGIRGVKLETIRVGGTLCTSTAALQKFCARLTDADAGTVPSPVHLTPNSRRAAEKAGRMLDRLGM